MQEVQVCVLVLLLILLLRIDLLLGTKNTQSDQLPRLYYTHTHSATTHFTTHDRSHTWYKSTNTALILGTKTAHWLCNAKTRKKINKYFR